MSVNPNAGSDEVSENAANEQTPPPADTTANPQTPADTDESPKAETKAAATIDETLAPRLTTDLAEIVIINDDFRDEDEDQADLSAEEMLELVNTYEETLTDVAEGKILRGIVVEVRENEVLLNIGFKSEGVISLDEFGGVEITPGEEFDVFLEKLENQDGLVALSKERADFLKVWDKIKTAHENNEIVGGTVDRRIKGGLVVKLWGVDTFLPGSQVALRQVPNLEDLIGKEIECRIIKKNKRRRNVVVSRRIVLELEREDKKKKLISELEKGQIRRGVVKNITDFGAFVDLGGIDGLLHITDLSWGRVQHPSEVVQIGDEIDVKVLDFEQERERISLGLKQLQSYPWEDVEKKYPEGSVVRGRVVSITNYGAFVELEKGVEGLIHISEMSWTRHIKHPSKVVSISDEVNVMVLKIDKDNEKISLGLKQTEEDPWESLTSKYPVGTIIEGKVRNLTDFGAFVEVEEGIDGLVHISDMSWTKRVRHPKEMLRKGESVSVQILDIDTQKRRISLGIKQLQENPWPNLADEFPNGRTVSGAVTRMLDHGLIVDLGNDIEGFVPTGHLGIQMPKLDKPQYYFKEGEELELKVIKMDGENRRIVLSLSEQLTDLGEEAQAEFIAAHPRLDDVAEADQAEEGRGDVMPGDDDLAREAADYADVVESVPPAEAAAAPVQEESEASEAVPAEDAESVATDEPAAAVEADEAAEAGEADEADEGGEANEADDAEKRTE